MGNLGGAVFIVVLGFGGYFFFRWYLIPKMNKEARKYGFSNV